MNTDTFEVVAPGVRTLIEDLGRPGVARLGVGGSGAWDRAALRLANRLVGNAEGAAGLECLAGGLILRCLADTTIAVTGAEAPITVEGQVMDAFAPLRVRAGAIVTIGRPPRGLRPYVAIRGGLEGERVFGSLASAPTAKIGPAALSTGMILATSTSTDEEPRAASQAVAAVRVPPEVTLRVLAGPRDDWFPDEAFDVLVSTAWTVAPETDRVGTRLTGGVLPRRVEGELSSEGVVRGAVQVPTSGEPLVFGPDHPTTGGYPVIACVIDEDADALAQAAPGTVVRFALVAPSW